MGNRRKSAMERRVQQYRNAGNAGLAGLTGMPRYSANGTLKRSEGRQNWPYGAREGVSPSILTVHAKGARNKYPRREVEA